MLVLIPLVFEQELTWPAWRVGLQVLSKLPKPTGICAQHLLDLLFLLFLWWVTCLTWVFSFIICYLRAFPFWPWPMEWGHKASFQQWCSLLEVICSLSSASDVSFWLWDKFISTNLNCEPPVCLVLWYKLQGFWWIVLSCLMPVFHFCSAISFASLLNHLPTPSPFLAVWCYKLSLLSCLNSFWFQRHDLCFLKGWVFILQIIVSFAVPVW